MSESPAANSLGAPVDGDITVTFSLEMDQNSITSSTFIVHGSMTGYHLGGITIVGSTTTFNSDIDFARGEEITVTLKDEIKATNDNYLVNPYVFTFTTETAIAPATYSMQTTFSTNIDNISTCAADFNLDGNIDLATLNDFSDEVLIYMNNGDGTFAEPTTHATNNTPTSLYAADINDDTYIDLVIGGTDDLSRLFNDNGNFGSAVTHSIDWPITDLATGDLNGDGYIDIAGASDSYSNEVLTMLNDGDGAFDIISLEPYLEFGTVCIWDFNGDGLLDIVGGEFEGPDIAVAFNQGNNGDFSNFTSLSVLLSGNIVAIAAADMDGDNNPDADLVVIHGTDVSVLENSGSGTFSVLATYSDVPIPTDLYLSDLDGDGDIDVTATVNAPDDKLLGIYLNDGLAQFTYCAGEDFGTSDIGYVIAAELDGINGIDLAVLSSGTSDLLNILLSTGDPTPTNLFSPRATYGLISGGGPDEVAAADFDSDVAT